MIIIKGRIRDGVDVGWSEEGLLALGSESTASTLSEFIDSLFPPDFNSHINDYYHYETSIIGIEATRYHKGIPELTVLIVVEPEST